MEAQAWSAALRSPARLLLCALPRAPVQSDALLREVGRRLARDPGGPASGDLPTRVHAAAAILTSLGADVRVEDSGDGLRVAGSGCPFSTVASRRPEMCRAVETLMGGLIGQPAESCCQHGERPKCCFAVRRGDQAA